jgi:outer membrane scaffolding protein for murein synthesis (MipA/OmpV family)
MAAQGFLGAGVSGVPDYEGSDHYEAFPAVFGRYTWDSGRYVDLGAPPDAGRAAALKFNLMSGSGLELGPLLQYRFKRDDVDNDQVDRMKEVDSAVEAGAFVGIRPGPWFVNLAFAMDVSDEHDGTVADLQGGYKYEASANLNMTFSASLSYAGDDYMQTYFGVSPADSRRSGLRRYNADAGFKDWGLGVSAQYRFSQSWGLLGSLNYYRLMGDAEDSPLVDGVGDANQYKGVLALVYHF